VGKQKKRIVFLKAAGLLADLFVFGLVDQQHFSWQSIGIHLFPRQLVLTRVNNLRVGSQADAIESATDESYDHSTNDWEGAGFIVPLLKQLKGSQAGSHFHTHSKIPFSFLFPNKV